MEGKSFFIISGIIIISIIEIFSIPHSAFSIDSEDLPNMNPQIAGSQNSGPAVLDTKENVDNTIFTIDTAYLAGKVNVSNLPRPEKSSGFSNIPFHTINHSLFSDLNQQPKFENPAKVVVSNPPLVNIGPSTGIHLNSGFDGLDLITSGGFFPPDVQVAVGPNHVVEMVNVAGKIWTKQGTPVSTISLQSFFLTNSRDSLSDPKILFDTTSGRWFASINDLTTNNVCVAVSATNNPTGTWFNYHFSFGNNFSDQPILGINDDKVIISANLFDKNHVNHFLGAQYLILDKSKMLSGSSIPFQMSSIDSSKFSIHPVQSLSSTSTLYMVRVGVFGTNQVQLFSVSGAVPNAVINTRNLFIPHTILPPGAIQTGTTSTINTGDARVSDAAWYQGKLWLSFNDGCTPTGDTKIRSCIHLIQINTRTLRINQNMDFGSIDFYYFYPALRIDSVGNLDLIFGYSSSTAFPSLAVTGQAVSDPPGTLKQPIILKLGSQSDTTHRYGDYFGAAVDPSTPTLVWLAGEYHSDSFDSFTWSTFVNSMTITPSS